ncbi:MAG: hypothetical protein NT093_01305 [Candidatus Moranbacteria bacterium]|nr:hypothetical protein [Candidatus Moranbacteria bacterium]
MLVPLIIVAALFLVSADGTAYLFKKLERGHWATRKRNLSPEAKSAASICVSCCLLLSVIFAQIAFKFFGLQNTLIAAIFIFVAHFSYRLPMTISDQGASKCVSRNEHRLKQHKRVRRYYSISFAKFALSAAGAVIFLFRDKILSLF